MIAFLGLPGPLEYIVVLVVVLLLFGNRLPGLAKSLAQGITEYAVPEISDHLVANLWLAEMFGATVSVRGNRVRIEGLGLRRRPHQGES